MKLVPYVVKQGDYVAKLAVRLGFDASAMKLVDQEGKPLANQRVLLRKGGKGGAERIVALDKDGKVELEGEDTYDVHFPDLPATKSS